MGGDLPQVLDRYGQLHASLAAGAFPTALSAMLMLQSARTITPARAPAGISSNDHDALVSASRCTCDGAICTSANASKPTTCRAMPRPSSAYKFAKPHQRLCNNATSIEQFARSIRRQDAERMHGQRVTCSLLWGWGPS